MLDTEHYMSALEAEVAEKIPVSQDAFALASASSSLFGLVHQGY